MRKESDMVLFKKKKEEQKSEFIINKKYKIPYSKGFKGFKKFQVVVHGDKESENNMNYFYDKDLSNATFEFAEIIENDCSKIILFINDLKVGMIWDDDQISAIKNDLIEKIHAEPKEEIIGGPNGTEIRHRLSILVKYKLSEKEG